MIFYLSLGVFIFLLGFQLFRNFKKINIKKLSKITFFISIVIIFLFYVYLTFLQYQALKNDAGMGKFFLPPYKSITYVIGYYFVRFALYYVISLFIALIFLFGTKFYNKKFQNKFFEEEESYLGAISIFLLGNKEWNYAWITYLVLLVVFAVIGTVIYTKILKKNSRFPLYWLWIPVAILAILIGRWPPINF